jgi:hypothetical protein
MGKKTWGTVFRRIGKMTQRRADWHFSFGGGKDGRFFACGLPKGMKGAAGFPKGFGCCTNQEDNRAANTLGKGNAPFPAGILLSLGKRNVSFRPGILFSLEKGNVPFRPGLSLSLEKGKSPVFRWNTPFFSGRGSGSVPRLAQDGYPEEKP